MDHQLFDVWVSAFSVWLSAFSPLIPGLGAICLNYLLFLLPWGGRLRTYGRDSMYKIITLSLVILLFGCTDESAKTEETAPGRPNPETSSAQETTQKWAVVKIGEHQYEFELTRCSSTQRFGTGKAKDGSDVTLTYGFPPANWKSRPASEGWSDNGHFRIRDKDNNLDWQASETMSEELTIVSAGQSQVDDFSIDGKSVSGNATFIDVNAIMTGSAEPVKGTFKLECS